MKRALSPLLLIVLGLLAYDAQAGNEQPLTLFNIAGSKDGVKFELQANVVSCGVEIPDGSTLNSEPSRLCSSSESKLFGNIAILDGTPHPGMTGGRLFDVGTLCSEKVTEKIDRAWIAFLDCSGCPLATKMANLAHTNPQAVLLYNQSACIFSSKSHPKNAPPVSSTSSTPTPLPTPAKPSPSPQSPPPPLAAPDTESEPKVGDDQKPPQSPDADPLPADGKPPAPDPSPIDDTPPATDPSPALGTSPADNAPPAADSEPSRPNEDEKMSKDKHSHSEKEDPEDDEDNDEGHSDKKRRHLFSRTDAPQKKTGVSLNGDGGNVDSSSRSAGAASSTHSNVFFDSLITLAMADKVTVEYLFKILLGPASSAPLPTALSSLKTRAALAVGSQEVVSHAVTDLMISISPVMAPPNSGDSSLLSMSKPVFVGVAIIVSLLVGYVLIAHVARPLYRRYRHYREDGDGMQPLDDESEHLPPRGDLEEGQHDGSDPQQQRNIRTSDWKALNMFPTSNFGSLRRSKGDSSFAPDHDPEKEMTEVHDAAQTSEKTALSDSRDQPHSGLPSWKHQQQQQQQQNAVTSSSHGGMATSSYEGPEGDDVGRHAHEVDDRYDYDSFLQNNDYYSTDGRNTLGYRYNELDPQQDPHLDRLRNNTTNYDQHTDDQAGNTAAARSWQRGVQSGVPCDEPLTTMTADRPELSNTNHGVPHVVKTQPSTDNSPECEPIYSRHGSDLFEWTDHPRRSLDIPQEGREEEAGRRMSPDSTATSSQPSSGKSDRGSGALRMTSSSSAIASTLRRSLEMQSTQVLPITEVETERDLDDHLSTTTAQHKKMNSTTGVIPVPSSTASSSQSSFRYSSQDDRTPMTRASLDVPRQHSQRTAPYWSSTDTTTNMAGRQPRASFAGDYPRRTSLEGLQSVSSATGAGSSSFRRSLDQGRLSTGVGGSPSSNLSGLQDVSGVTEGVTTKINLAELLEQEEAIAAVLHPPQSPSPKTTKPVMTVNTRPSEPQTPDNIVYAPVPITPASATRLTRAEELNDRTRQKRTFRANAVKPDPILTSAASMAASSAHNARSQRKEHAAVPNVHGDGSSDENNSSDSDARVSPQCPICLEQYSKNAMVRTLPCHHYFHQSCIDSWLLANDRDEWACPVCKQDLMVLSGHPHMSRSWRASHLGDETLPHPPSQDQDVSEASHHRYRPSIHQVPPRPPHPQQQHPPQEDEQSPAGPLSSFGSLWTDPDKFLGPSSASPASPKTKRTSFLRLTSRNSSSWNDQDSVSAAATGGSRSLLSAGSKTSASVKTPLTPSKLRGIFHSSGASSRT
ncbi:hypothetical protein BGZ73_003462 [Actinomortierella ambigua]|nr:hypothetical protein BGZ73_003462 [Actinomortierella ambigua]